MLLLGSVAASYRKLKVTYEVRKMLCPLCQHELIEAKYLGSKVFALAKYAVDYVRDSWMPALEDGYEVWQVVAESDRRKPYASRYRVGLSLMLMVEPCWYDKLPCEFC